MILPKQNNVPEVGFPRAKSWLFYGPPKVGKTEFAAGFPKTLICDLQEGAFHIKTAPVLNIIKEAQDAGISPMDALREAFDLIAGPQGQDFDNIAVDTLDDVYDWTEQEACAHLSKKLKMKIENVGEAPHGADWGEARRRLLGFVEGCKTLGKNVFLIAHSKASSTEPGSVAVKAQTIDLPGKLGKRLPGKVDIIGYCHSIKEGIGAERTINRYISFEPYDEIEAGCRYRELNGKVLPMSFKAIKECFDNPQETKAKPRIKGIVRR